MTPPATATLLSPSKPLHDEAARSLHDLADGKTGGIPADLLVRHLLRVYRSAEWPVQREAMQALLRRIAFAERDGLRVASCPRGAQPFGQYTTRRARENARGWRTRLDAIEPVLVASCDCPDFLRGSLGLCKHVLVVLAELASKKRAFEELRQAPLRARNGARLEWDPIRPLLGAGDPLERLHVAAISAPDLTGRRLFCADARGTRRLPHTHAQDPATRLALVRSILARGKRATIEVDPAAQRLLDDEEARLERLESARTQSKACVQALRSLKRTLHPFQRQGVERFLRTGRLLLADDMGLGKTVQAIAGCHALWKTGAVKRGLIVVPASLKPQWLREWRAWTDAPITMLDGTPAERAAAWRSTRSGFLLVNYEQVIRDHDQVLRWRADLAVLDEAQRIKNWETKSAACVKALEPAWRLILTGTPMENRLDELASLMDWIDDQALQPKWRLVPFHAIVADGERDTIGVRHLDVLRERLAHCFLRRVRQDVLKELPPRTDTCVPIEITDDQRGEHDELKPPIMRLMAIAIRRPLTREQFLKLMQLLNLQRMIANALAQVHFEEMWPALQGAGRPNAELLETLRSPKLLQLRDILSALIVDQERKVVVFSQWRRMLLLAEWAVRDLVADHGLRAVFFTGEESQKRRTHNLVDFHDDPKTRILFASDAGGVGLNLQRAASACINLELPWNPAVLEQRIGRIYRMGQTKPIDVYNLVAQGCIEERIANLVSDKRAFFRELFDGQSDEVRFEGSASFMQGLKQIVGVDSPPSADEGRASEADGDQRDGGDATERGLDEMLERADETAGSVDVSTASAAASSSSSSSSSSSASASASASASSSNGKASAKTSSVESVDALEMLDRVTVARAEDGSLTLRAPPEAASTLARLFSQFAKLLDSAAKR